MAFRRVVSRAPLSMLEPLFDEIRRDAGVVEQFPADALAEAVAGGGEDDPEHVAGGRVDRTELPLATIDPPGSRDLDQAVWLERGERGLRVFYAIADVAAHILPGGPLDQAAHARGETVYCPDRRVPLHPPVMSEGYASLLPGQRTKAVLWTLEVGPQGELEGTRLERAWVRSRHQYDYLSLHSNPPAEARGLLGLMRELGDARRALSPRRGGVTLPKPSQEFDVVDGDVSLAFRASLPVEDDNAQISLLTGEAAAGLMLEAGIGVLRTMPPAPASALRRLRRQAKALGIDWPESLDYPGLLQRLDARAPATGAFLTQAVGLFRGARWEPFDIEGLTGEPLPLPESLSHGALAVPYAHVTAPLRRLVDRYGTEVCLAHAEGVPVPRWVAEALPRLGEQMAASVARAGAVDRRCVDVVEAALLADRVGEVFDAVALDDRTVQIADPAVVARYEGALEPGEAHQVRLAAADPVTGVRFAAL